MTQPDDRIVKEVANLVASGEAIARDASHASSSLGSERVEELLSIASRTGQLIRRLYGANSQYQENLERVLATKNFSMMHSNYFRHVAELVGIVKGIQSDLATGMLDDHRVLIRAEVFGNFLEMAEHLVREGYKDAAAVLLGAVLEDSLRSLAARSNIATANVQGKPMTIDPLNIAVAKAGVYGPLVQKQITSWANLRNDAAHGQFSKYDADHVQQMLLFVQKFCADYMR
jgi:hypothetical protein